MENKLLNTFFYVNGRLLNIKAFFETDKVLYILAPLLPVYAVFTSFTELLNGNFIVLNTIILIFGVFLSFLLTVVSIYHFKNVDVFKLFKRYVSNRNLCQSNDKSKTINKSSDKDVSILIAENKDLINKCFSGIRRIGLVNDDITQSDFDSLIANCFVESETGFSFNLEVNANQVNGFVRELLKPLLERIDNKNTFYLNKILPLLNYKKSTGYINMKVSTSSNAPRASLTRDQRALYADLKKM